MFGNLVKNPHNIKRFLEMIAFLVKFISNVF